MLSYATTTGRVAIQRVAVTRFAAMRSSVLSTLGAPLPLRATVNHSLYSSTPAISSLGSLLSRDSMLMTSTQMSSSLPQVARSRFFCTTPSESATDAAAPVEEDGTFFLLLLFPMSSFGFSVNSIRGAAVFSSIFVLACFFLSFFFSSSMQQHRNHYHRLLGG
jgi:hypothetical protein